jgi:hypothetical protein
MSQVPLRRYEEIGLSIRIRLTHHGMDGEL